MVQYLMRKEKDFEHLKIAIKNYNPTLFFVRPFSLGSETKHIKENLQNKKLTFKTKKGLIFFINKKEILNLPLKDYHKGFAIEYHNETGQYAWPKDYHPMDPGLPKPYCSVLRTVIDDLLIEIEFEKKIKVDIDGMLNLKDYYWKIKK